MDRARPCAEVIAHRGASAYAAEHTFAAYDLALQQGADTLELDLRATADGRLVVLHDESMLRTLDDPREISHVSLDALEPSRRPLTFEAVLDRYGASTSWLVELKGPTQAWHSQVAEILAARRLTDRAVVQGFDAVALRWLKHRQPELRVAPLFWRRPGRARLRAVATFATAIGVRHVAVDPALLRHARACGLAVRAWTANAPSDIERLLDMGVDGVISDVPDVARALVDTRMPLALSA